MIFEYLKSSIVQIWSIFSIVIRAPQIDELKVALSKPCEKSDGDTVGEWTGSFLDEEQRHQVGSLISLTNPVEQYM